jgi:hypothetical protein
LIERKREKAIKVVFLGKTPEYTKSPLCVSPGLKLPIVDAQTIFDLFRSQALECRRKNRHREFRSSVAKAQCVSASADTCVEIDILRAKFQESTNAVGGVINGQRADSDARLQT